MYHHAHQITSTIQIRTAHRVALTAQIAPKMPIIALFAILAIIYLVIFAPLVIVPVKLVQELIQPRVLLVLQKLIYIMVIATKLVQMDFG